MTEISNMVSYYNHSLMYGRQQQAMSPASPASQQMSAATTPHHQPSSVAQETSQQQCANWYYQHHHHQQQQQQYLAEAAAAAESTMPTLWPAHAHPAYLQYHHQHAAYQQQQMQVAAANNAQQTQQSSLDWSNEEANNNNNNNSNNNNNNGGVGTSEPSPAITVSGSEISSPGTPSSPTGNNNNLNVPNNNNNNNSIAGQMRPNTNRSPFEWMKKNSYQPNPGKTRTKEKYRVVYTEHQRLELEKEFYSSKYITIRRKAELATSLALSERQVKIWFQNRRAKERKQTKKRCELEQRDIKPILDAHGVAHAPPTNAPTPVSGMANLSLNNMSMSSLMSNLMPPAPSPTALMAHHHHHHHHHPLLGAAVAAAAHHPQHPVIGM